MIVALIDNGSLEPAAHRNLRVLAAALSARTKIEVHAVSWKHSDQIPAETLEGQPAAILAPWFRARLAGGDREFLFVPFFVSTQGAIGSALRSDLEKLSAGNEGCRFAFTEGLAARGALTRIVADRIRETIIANALRQPAVVVVDHGGPSAASATLRNQIAAEVRQALRREIGPLTAASLEGEDYAHSQPLFADALTLPNFNHGDVVVAPLFLAPGRHAGPQGDLAQIAEAAEDRLTAEPLHCHFTDLVGTHPLVVDTLAEALNESLSTFHAAA
jgi:sirohydrochlorin ferrochelatase